MTASAAAPSIDASVNPYWRRNLYVCLIGSFTNMAAMTLMLPFLPNYIRDLGVHDPDAIVFWSATAFSAAFLAAAMVSPIWGTGPVLSVSVAWVVPVGDAVASHAPLGPPANVTFVPAGMACDTVIA